MWFNSTLNGAEAAAGLADIFLEKSNGLYGLSRIFDSQGDLNRGYIAFTKAEEASEIADGLNEISDDLFREWKSTGIRSLFFG